MLTSLVLAAACAAGSPFDDAVAVWHFADATEARSGEQLSTVGTVALGAELTEEDRAASLARAGDGRVARLDGGHLSAGASDRPALLLAGPAMSLCVRFRLDPGVTDTPILSRHGGGTRLSYNLFVTDLGAGPALGFELGADARDRPLCVSVPLAAIGPEAWHDAIVRFTGPRLELFVDGVLVDEEWPIGAVRANAEPLLIGAESHGEGVIKQGFRGLLDHAALWSRALTDEEVTLLSGGPEAVARRDREILGPERASVAYWRPRGLGISVGDCMPFYHEGRFHVFYLYDRRHHGSKWGLGAHQWAHISSTDLVHWEQHPMAIPIDAQWECSICTGSVVEQDGTFHAFYATRKSDGTQHLGHATSPDCIHFTKQQPNPFLSAPEGYDPMDLRDPLVTTDPVTGGYRMLVTTRLTDGRDGCIGKLLSDDLRAWRMVDPLLVVGRVTDCPDLFEWNGTYYLLAEFVYWTAPGPDGPWTAPTPNSLDVLYVPKTAPFGDNRRIYVSWLPDGGWGGDLIFRVLVRLPDGRLGTRFVPELMPAAADPLPLAGGASTTPTVWSDLPSDYVLTCRVTPEAGLGTLTLGLRSGAAGAFALRIDRAGGTVSLGPAGGDSVAGISHVEGLAEPFDLTVVVLRDIVDVSIGGTRTIIARAPRGTGDRLAVESDGGAARLDALAVRPILAP